MKKGLTALGLLSITMLGIWFRLDNLSPFKFYPDAYQSLIVAGNISDYHSAFGMLGNNGMLYPYYLMWSRPGFPILINLFAQVAGDPVKSAQFVALVAGITSVFISFFYIKKVFSSTLTGLIGALLLATSFNHTVWGGFIYTETTGVLLILLVLWRLFNGLEKRSRWANWPDFLIGGLLAAAFFTRYEYILVTLPLIFLVWKRNPAPLIKLCNIAASLLFFSAIFLIQLYPLPYLVPAAMSQLRSFLLVIGLGAIFTIGFLGVSGLISPKLRIDLEKLTNLGLRVLIWLLAGLLVAQGFVPGLFLTRELTAMRNFFGDDILLGVTALAGLSFLLSSLKYKVLGYFTVGAAIVLLPAYYMINPLMQRYWTHLLPFLLIPAVFGTKLVLEKSLRLIFNFRPYDIGKGAALLLIFVILLVWQLPHTLGGIKSWNRGDWFRPSYEEKAAILVSQRVNPAQDHILLSALPEPYFIFNGISTRSIIDTDQPPFVSIDDLPGLMQVYIIEDMGMADIFPNFTRFLNDELGNNYQVGQFWAGEKYRYALISKPEDRPVVIYEISVGELKEKLLKVSQN